VQPRSGVVAGKSCGWPTTAGGVVG